MVSLPARVWQSDVFAKRLLTMTLRSHKIYGIIWRVSRPESVEQMFAISYPGSGHLKRRLWVSCMLEYAEDSKQTL